MVQSDVWPNRTTAAHCPWDSPLGALGLDALPGLRPSYDSCSDILPIYSRSTGCICIDLQRSWISVDGCTPSSA